MLPAMRLAPKATAVCERIRPLIGLCNGSTRRGLLGIRELEPHDGWLTFCQPDPPPRRRSAFRRTAANDLTLAPRSTALLGRETGNARLAGFFQPMKPFSCGKALRAPNLRQRM